MGSSLGLALKARCPDVRIQAFARREETRALVLERGAADAVYADPAAAVAGADVVVFCVPVLTIHELAKACLPGLKPGAILTDVGSTKGELNRLMTDVLAGSEAVFVGSHPICGSEEQGAGAGFAELYENAVTVVTPQPDTPDAAIEQVSALWKKAGSSVALMSAEEHDCVLARTSHLPHIVAAALVFSVGENGAFCGSGFRDTTRIAEGSPAVWRDILTTNRVALQDALTTCRAELDRITQLLDENDPEKIEAWLADAAAKRKELLS